MKEIKLAAWVKEGSGKNFGNGRIYLMFSWAEL